MQVLRTLALSASFFLHVCVLFLFFASVTRWFLIFFFFFIGGGSRRLFFVGSKWWLQIFQTSVQKSLVSFVVLLFSNILGLFLFLFGLLVASSLLLLFILSILLLGSVSFLVFLKNAFKK